MTPASTFDRSSARRRVTGTLAGRRLGLALGGVAVSTALLISGAPVAAADPGSGPSPDSRIGAERTPRIGQHVPATEAGPEARCSVPSTADDSVLVTLKQVADERQVSPKVRLAMYETAWVESHANNLACGDRDSLGVFQQRSSMGWGGEEELLDPEYAANKFLDGNDAAGVIATADLNPTWTAGQVSQETQRSAYPDRYDESQEIASDLIARAADLDTDPATPGEHSWPVLKEGASGTKVMALQLLLNQHGASLEADGAFGELTAAAVSDFQSANGLDVDGVVGEQTWSALVVGAEQGSDGPAVEAIQWALNAQGYDVSVDGAYGPQTAGAVASLRDYYGLDAGDSVDTRTWLALVH